MTLKIIVPPHPLIAHWLTMLRNNSTPPSIYSVGLGQIGRWLTYEALREWLPYREEEVETATGKTTGTVIETRVPLLAIAKLPGGLELWQGARDILPNANLYLGEIPSSINQNAGILIYIDQISTGEDLIKDLMLLKEQNIESKRIKVITALASSPGLKKIGESFLDITIYSACIDPDLTEKGEIMPGIGNPIQRINTRIATTN